LIFFFYSPINSFKDQNRKNQHTLLPSSLDSLKKIRQTNPTEVTHGKRSRTLRSALRKPHTVLLSRRSFPSARLRLRAIIGVNHA
ncbi:TPA: hypothetical protein DIC21_03280, partial [Candidatus Uhrbacteria bacterium]|nr:hypothetical protein [Candidatus Uhrbacteria bacterium]